MKTQVLLSAAAVAMISASASAQVFNGTPHGAIPDNVPAGISQSIVIAANPNTVQSIIVSTTMAHTWAGDIIMTLSHNDGFNTVSADIMRRVGSTTVAGVGDSSNLGGTYRWGDSFAGSFPTAAGLVGDAVAVPAGDYRAFTNIFTAPIGTTNPAVALNSIFGGRSYNGTWTLTVSDNAGLDTGNISAWSIELAAVPAPGALALLGLAGLAGTRRRRA